MLESRTNPLRKTDEMIQFLEEVFDTAEKLLSSPDQQDALSDQSYLLESLWAEAAIHGDRRVLDVVAERLDFLSAAAFREADGPRADWTLTDWGRLWEGFSGLAKIYLELDQDGQRQEDLTYIRDDETRKLYLLAFLNETGEGELRRIKDIAGFLEEKQKVRPKSNAVHNRLNRLTQRGLVRRSGPVQGWYELTQVGYEVLQELKRQSEPSRETTEQAIDILRDISATHKPLKKNSLPAELVPEYSSKHASNDDEFSNTGKVSLEILGSALPQSNSAAIACNR